MSVVPTLFTAPYYPDAWNIFDQDTGRPNGRLTYSNHFRTLWIINKGGSGWQTSTRSNVGHKVTGRYYAEVKIVGIGGGSNQPCIALYPKSGSTYPINVGFPSFTNTNGWGLNPKSPSTNGSFSMNGGNFLDYGSTVMFAEGNILMVAADFDQGKFWWGYNGTWISSGNPASLANASWSNLNAYGSTVDIHLATWLVAGEADPDIVMGGFENAHFTYTKPYGYAPWNDDACCGWSPTEWRSAEGAATTPIFTDSNLTVSGGSHLTTVPGTMSSASGKWYFEVEIVTLGTGNQQYIGVLRADASKPPAAGNYWALVYNSPNSSIYHSGSYVNVTGMMATGWIVMVAVDLTAGKIWFGNSGTWFNSGNPAAGTSPIYSDLTGLQVAPFVQIGASGTGTVMNGRFAASDFTYAPPTGFQAWCAAGAAGVTWSTVDKASTVALSSGNLVAVGSGGGVRGGVRATVGARFGKKYYEVGILAADVITDNVPGVGIMGAGTSLTTASGRWNSATDGASLYAIGTSWQVNAVSTGINPLSPSIHIGIAVDLDAGKIWWAYNNVWCLSGDPATGANPTYTFTPNTLMYPAARCGSVQAYFASSSFQYTPPTGFEAWG